eukprot:CAMPEP_0172832268 /NCGR_PEP_ID=MMETSP1075-20121228/23538_1 /TAXON_ID=2916 /ORGANISM="Ceratium fusus, Strain PA161109" /LENGTH=57 /DNA_ID=CAMNT_0013674839 /DNA_START=38 /DNA_END=208 /DNA_ORIENTATION=-
MGSRITTPTVGFVAPWVLGGSAAEMTKQWSTTAVPWVYRPARANCLNRWLVVGAIGK